MLKFLKRGVTVALTLNTPITRSITAIQSAEVVQNPFQKAVQNYFNNEQYDVNWKIDGEDGFCHHHFGIGNYDSSILSIKNPETRLQRTAQELHRMENKQAELLLNQFGKITPNDRIVDAGCGRGGTSIMAALKFGCKVDGLNISDKQVAHATAQAKKFDLESRVKFHFRNMLDNRMQSHSVRVVWNNESTMYVNLFDLFKEHVRILQEGGRYVTITGAFVSEHKSRAVHGIDEFYGCNVHHLQTYFKALLANGLLPIKVFDLTETAMPYWDFRQQSTLVNGVERFFQEAYRGGDFRYMLIVAQKVKLPK